jgi:hypothetical protein
MSFYLKKYLVYKNILLYDKQYGGTNMDMIKIADIKELENQFLPKELNNLFDKNFNNENIIKINTTNKLYKERKDQFLIYGTSIFNHIIVYILLEDGTQYSMILEDDKNYLKIFREKKDSIYIKKVILKNINGNLLNKFQRKQLLDI